MKQLALRDGLDELLLLELGLQLCDLLLEFGDVRAELLILLVDVLDAVCDHRGHRAPRKR